MVVVAGSNLSNIASTTARAITNNKKRRANVIQPKGEHNMHFLGRCFTVMFSFSIVLSWCRLSMLSGDDSKLCHV